MYTSAKTFICIVRFPLETIYCLHKNQNSHIEALKGHLHWANPKANCFLSSLSLLNVNIKLDSQRTHLEAMSLSLSPQCKRTLIPPWQTITKELHILMYDTLRKTCHFRSVNLLIIFEITTKNFHWYITIHQLKHSLKLLRIKINA